MSPATPAMSFAVPTASTVMSPRSDTEDTQKMLEIALKYLLTYKIRDWTDNLCVPLKGLRSRKDLIARLAKESPLTWPTEEPAIRIFKMRQQARLKDHIFKTKAQFNKPRKPV
ncbi:hypothetical protein BV25DRAFT_1919495 [Artomyces pyxidatus]|uniref:Uncharacterized protein n=1 Tax=Artomyces pyxidatus TaxID=48021 RepID=A0ACB8SP04_9AGAM|nr:hypothetical protein BV25DRAFT_1919495 [Artomyces pyxidatus]